MTVFLVDAWNVATRDAAIGDAFAKAQATEAAEERAQHELTAAEDSLTEAEQVDTDDPPAPSFLKADPAQTSCSCLFQLAFRSASFVKICAVLPSSFDVVYIEECVRFNPVPRTRCDP